MNQWYENLRNVSRDYMRPEIKVRDFVVLIASYGRPEGLKKMTMTTFKEFFEKVDYRIMVSDDDKTLPKYLEMYGDKVYVFNKDDVLKNANVDTCDALDIKSVIFFERNIEFKVARELGYRYFMHLEDDYLQMDFKLMNHESLMSCHMDIEHFDKICEMYFRVLDSSPFLSSVCMAQGGDYVGGKTSSLSKNGYRFKGMNIYCFDTQKEVKLPGRINEDASAYYVNGKLGKIFLTLPLIQLTQLPTQNNQGGVSDVYKKFGTYLKTIYTVIQRPDAMKISTFATSGSSKTHLSDTRRIHHKCSSKLCFTKIISDSYAKTTIHYSEVEKPDLNPDFFNQKSYMDLHEPDLNDLCLETCLEDW